ncbi:MAG: glycoside hydrolase family 3 C-terminal domain-containing protein, partial [Solobacterium sp.]|nr:glycoside hydrolase family 3 C-terminal domain-containing protein [Solobacterium sp.]
MYRFGQVLADECIRDGVDILLGPGINHKRSPRCGRNFEYFSEDPILSSELASGYIQGLQSCGIAACVKHFAANSRETGRLVQDSVVDERTLQEIYLYQFERVIRQARPWSIMAAYNQLNGAYCCENEELLKDILRKQWGYDGTVISDWGAVSDPLQSAKNGLNIEMPGPDHGTADALLEGIKQGTLSEAALRESTEYIRKLVERCSHKTDRDPEVDHFAFAQELAERSAVLLKNEGVLPLKQERIALIGAFAEKPRYQGAGSSKVHCLSVDSLKGTLEEAGLPFVYAQGYRTDSDDSDPVLIKEALEAAEQCDTVVLMLGLPDGKEAEGFDRPHLSLPENQNRLVEHILQVNRNVIVVLQCGAPVTVPWAEDVKGILLMYLSGCRGGKALKRLLYGEVNPSGKLAETFPLREEDVPCEPFYDNDLLQVQYREGIFTGYRYYSTFGKEVRWPFGYGLSYTAFRYDGFTVSTDNERLYAEVTLTNTGTCTGRETVQVYAGLPESRIARPSIELKGFTTVELSPGETRTVIVEIPLEDLKYWDVQEHSRLLETGVYTLYAASSSQDLLLKAQIALEGTAEPYSTLSMKRAETEEEF